MISVVSIQRNAHNAVIDTASILAFWPLRRLHHLRYLRQQVRKGPVLRALRCTAQCRYVGLHLSIIRQVHGLCFHPNRSQKI